MGDVDGRRLLGRGLRQPPEGRVPVHRGSGHLADPGRVRDSDQLRRRQARRHPGAGPGRPIVRAGSRACPDRRHDPHDPRRRRSGGDGAGDLPPGGQPERHRRRPVVRVRARRPRDTAGLGIPGAPIPSCDRCRRSAVGASERARSRAPDSSPRPTLEPGRPQTWRPRVASRGARPDPLRRPRRRRAHHRRRRRARGGGPDGRRPGYWSSSPTSPAS